MAVFVKLPDIPVTVTVEVPVAAVLVAMRVSEAPVAFVVRADVTPLGNDDTVKLTVPVKPFTGVVVIVVEPPLGSPCVIDTLVGAAARLKFGTGEPVGQLLTRFAALTVPIPVAKSQPVVARNAGLKELLDVERTPNEPAGS